MKYRQAIKVYHRQGGLHYKRSTVRKAMATIQLTLDRHLIAADSAYADAGVVVTSATLSYGEQGLVSDVASPFYKKELGETNE